MDIPRRLIKFIGDYMRTYLVDGTPDFSGDTYFDVEDAEAAKIKPEQRKLHVVDSYSMSVTLCLATLGFLRVYRQGLRSQRMLQEVDELEKLSSQRLTAAMVGLLRSFTVNTFDPSDPPGQTMCTMINQSGVATEILVRNLLDELAEIRAGLRQELTIGLGQVAEELENRGRLFECGWSWGVVDGAPEIAYATDIGQQPTGVAEARPYLYFTVVALDGIQDLFSERTRILGLLNEEQQRLARALQLRWDLTRQFWAKIATFGGGPVAARGPAVEDHRRPRVRLLLGAAHLDRHRGRGQRADRRRRRRPDRAAARGTCQPRADHPQADGGRPGGRPAHAGHAAAADRQREGGRGAPARSGRSPATPCWCSSGCSGWPSCSRTVPPGSGSWISPT